MKGNNIQKLIRVVEKLRSYDAEMQAQTIQLLLTASQDKSGVGMPMATLADKVGLAQSSCSRNVAALGRVNRRKEPGLNLLVAVEDPLDCRRKLVRLTPKGQRLIDELTELCS